MYRRFTLVAVSFALITPSISLGQTTGSANGGGGSQAEACNNATRSASVNAESSRVEYERYHPGQTYHIEVKPCVCSKDSETSAQPGFSPLEHWTCQVSWGITYK